MKNQNFLFIRICLLYLFIFLVRIQHVDSQCCSYTLSMHDSYGDGWNGGYLEIFRNNVSLGHFSATGSATTTEIQICENDSLRFIYTPLDYENENVYELYSPGWNLIFQDGPNPGTGEILSTQVHCDTFNLPGNHPCTALPFDTLQCALGDNTSFPGSGVNPYCAEYHDGDVWYLIQTPPSGNLLIQTDSGSINDTGIAVWTGPDCENLRELVCDDDSGVDAFSSVTLYDQPAGQNIYVQVWGYGGARGSFRLCARDLGLVKLDSSELPIISINTLGQNIINDTKIDALMQIRYHGPGVINHLTDTANVYNGHIGIEIRGASSSGYPQTPYSLETRNPNGLNKDVALLGMPPESDWVLISNFNDRSLIRNLLSSRLSAEMDEYAPRMKLAEVMLNNLYKGIYVFGEKIKRDKYRVDIAKMDSTDIAGDKVTGGYILQQNYWDPSTSFQSNYAPIDHPGFDVHFVYEYPKPDAITPEQKTYIAMYIDSLETALYNKDFADPINGYRKYLDEKSFIDYFLLNELARNNDGFKKSVFFHKDRYSKGGKLKAGPIWDFDWAWKNIYGCDIFSAQDGSGWAYHINDCPTDNYSTGWYVRLLEDSSFVNHLKCTYEEYRQTIFDTAYIFNYIDSMGLYVQHAQERHFRKWPILGISGPAPEVNAIATTYPAELDTLKSWIGLRIKWLDDHMPGLCETSTAIHFTNQDNENILYYPNPSSGSIHFEGKMNGPLPATWKVFDTSGRLVTQHIFNTNKISFDYELEERGIYFFIFSNSQGEVRRGKMIRN